MATLPIRLIICVDGAQHSVSSKSSETNVYRIYASLQRGICIDNESGHSWNQIVSYIPGLGRPGDLISKDHVQASLFGRDHFKQIEDVYESCSKISGEQDEVWLFGSSRGAFVVRAVAGLLHTFGAIQSAGTPDFARDFKQIMDDARIMYSQQNLAMTPALSKRPGPKVRFIGVFDTVNPFNDDTLDISFNRSIRHMRHAVALHEDRKALSVEVLSVTDHYGTTLANSGRSFIQAYFVGRHDDLIGSSKSRGLALYPCQWMLLEAWKFGLALDCTNQAGNTQYPLAAVLPNLISASTEGQLWSCTTENGIVTSMQDIRAVHDTTQNSEQPYAIKLKSTRLGFLGGRTSRDPFTGAGYLDGYCDWAPQGAIIHPSVYLLLDVHVHIALETKELKMKRCIEGWRSKMLGVSNSEQTHDFWSDGDDADARVEGAIRILVCGNTGVGKSTLINKTFGVDVQKTQSSHRARGIHDVREEVTWDGRPDLIVHDSGGFEAGTEDELRTIEQFLKDRSETDQIVDRVHIIWFCIDINSTRTLQKATEKLFLAIANHAQDVPIVVVATKKDELLDIEFGAHRKLLKREGRPFDMVECELFAEMKVQERLDTIRMELESVVQGRLDACVAVSQDDDESVAQLSKTTSHCFDSDNVRLLYIRAQVTGIDLKIELAFAEIMRRYKKMVHRSSAAGWVPLGHTITRKVSKTLATRSIINAFGLSNAVADVAIVSLRADAWKSFASNAELAVAEFFHLAGLSATGLAFGSPIWLLTGSASAARVIPATCRLYLIMACDLTLVLARSFKEVTFRANAQPNEKDVSAAARIYTIRGYPEQVHRDIKELIPRKDIRASFKIDSVQRGVEDLLERYKEKLIENMDSPHRGRNVRSGRASMSGSSSEADSVFRSDLLEANTVLQELQGDAPPRYSEVEGTTPIVELSAEMRAVELVGSPVTSLAAELVGSPVATLSAKIQEAASVSKS